MRANMQKAEFKPRECEATFIFCFLVRYKVLEFQCNVLYDYLNDEHLQTFWRAMLRKHDPELKGVAEANT